MHRDIHIVLQTIQMKLILLCVWVEWADLGSAKTALKFKYDIYMYMQGISLESAHTISCVCHSIIQCLEYLGCITLTLHRKIDIESPEF